MSETLGPALSAELDRKAERLMKRLCDLELKPREEHLGPIGRGPIRIAALGIMLEMLEDALEAD